MENTTEDSKNQQEQQEKKADELTIEIRRFQNLLEILKEPKKVIVLSFAIALIGVLLFGGITLIVLSIKRLYPYNDITTNAMGTTTLKSENKNVSYFLLNSAELWANSGIRVKKGQTITIKSSGKKHSAIHHLVKDADGNSPRLREPWVGTEGFPIEFDTRLERDGERSKYRIYPNANQDILLLQIVSDDATKLNRPVKGKEDTNRFLVVGNKMEDIHIDFNGTLYFAVNDVVLDDETIIKALLECDENTINKLNDNNYINKLLAVEDSLRQEFFKEAKKEAKAIEQEYEKANKQFVLGKEQNKKAKQEMEQAQKMKIDSLYDKKYDEFTKNAGVVLTYSDGFGPCKFGYDKSRKRIELYGYYMHRYINAWYEDNVGSFLILVETVNE